MEEARLFHRIEDGKEIWSVIFDSPDFGTRKEAEEYRDKILKNIPPHHSTPNPTKPHLSTK